MLPPAASRRRSCDGKSAGVLVCKRARNRHGVAAVRCVETSLTGLHLRSERLRSQSLTVPSSVCGNPPRPGKESLLAEARFHRDALASLGAPAREHCCSALGLHPRSKAVLFRTLTPVRLKCALGHEKSLLLVSSMAYGQTKSINEAEQGGKREAGGCGDGRQGCARWGSSW